MDLWDIFSTTFWSIEPCVHLPCCIMLWNIVEKSQIKMKNKFQKNSQCAKHNLESALNLYYKKFVDYHKMIGNFICFSELFLKENWFHLSHQFDVQRILWINWGLSKKKKLSIVQVAH
jgi:hypothetical protein